MLDGGAYRSSSATTSSPTPRASPPGPTASPNAVVDGFGVRTNNPPCGAMRGFGAVQVCFAHEAQMDKLADALRRRPGRAAAAQRAWRPGDTLLTGQVIDGHAAGGRGDPAPAPTLPAARRRPRPTTRWPVPAAPGAPPTPPTCAAASASRSASRTSCTPRASTTTPRPACALDDGVATVTCAAAEVGQGFVTLVPADRPRRSSASTTWWSRPADTVDRLGRLHLGQPPDVDVGRRGRAGLPRRCGPRCWPHVAAATASTPATSTSSTAGSWSVDGDVDVAAGRARRRAGVRGDRRVPPRADLPARRRRPGRRPRVVRLRRPPRRGRRRPRARARAGGRSSPPRRTSGKVLNPLQLLGQIEGGIAQGVGLAVMEEILLERRPGAEPVVHRLPDPHRARHARGRRSTLDRGARARRAVRGQGRGRAADDLVDPGRGRRHPRRHRPAARRACPVRPADIALGT